MVSEPLPLSIDSASRTYSCLLFQGWLPQDGWRCCWGCFQGSYPKLPPFSVWKSLQCCYNYILNQDSRSVLPYFDGFSLDLKYDVFKVVYVSGDGALNFHLFPPQDVGETRKVHNVTQDLNRIAE
ncbi:hypothetical protein HAX54_018844 [Datura stramonium]|uniref:DUF7392 domain-containing protein n=1 Tax=Datura stramonium TaxID=4076 RepID=A0ABS8RMM3_DATST|nr:hypothetical protein [Datura stramonium]